VYGTTLFSIYGEYETLVSVIVWLVLTGTASRARPAKANTETTRIRPVTRVTLGTTEMNHPAN
jgi:hypothetical protein